MPRPYELETGSTDSTGSAIEVVTGFTPKRVELENRAGLCKLVWTDQFNSGSGLKSVTDGTLSVTAGGITPSTTEGRGFTIGTDADINPVGGETITWTAFY